MWSWFNGILIPVENPNPLFSKFLESFIPCSFNPWFHKLLYSPKNVNPYFLSPSTHKSLVPVNPWKCESFNPSNYESLIPRQLFFLCFLNSSNHKNPDSSGSCIVISWIPESMLLQVLPQACLAFEPQRLFRFISFYLCNPLPYS